MPVYVYEHPESGEFAEVVQGMNEDHVYTDKEGVEWNRVFFPSELNTTGRIDPWNQADFINKTGNDSGTLGDMMDRSKDLSESRASENGGVDPVKQKYFKDYSRRRNGTKHPEENKKKSAEGKGWKIDFD
jgi:hypothetical protein